MKAKKYKKSYSYAYIHGTDPILDLIKYKRDKVIKVLLHLYWKNKEGVQILRQTCERLGIPYEFATKAIDKLSAKENTYAIGVFDKYQSPILSGKNHVLLVNPTNTGNMGTIIRTMVGFGIHDLAIIRPAVDVFDAKVLRSSMGSFFILNFTYFDSIEEYIEKYPENKLYLFMLDGKNTLENTSFEKPYTLAFGNEGEGLPKEFKKLGQTLYIPHSKNIDSLNLSVAASLALYKAYQQNLGNK